MSNDLIHDGTSSWWDGTVTTLCGQVFPGGADWKDAWFAVQITCPACIRARKQCTRR